MLTSLGACLLDLIPLAVLILFFCLVNQVGRGSGLTVFAVRGVLHRSAGVGDLPPRGGGAGVHRVSPVAQPVDRHHPPLLLPAAPDWGCWRGTGWCSVCGGYWLFDRKEA